ncbi:MAG: ABC transporter ATP-binding protein [Lachnospiraceae bacterium]|nr:ABC transporter ATP-binding protein [Lachnospiraceae bacterium]
MEYAIQLVNVNKHLGRRHILKNVSFQTYPGEVFGFLGPNGAGKTTTIKLLTGLLKMEEGSVSICGHDIEKEFTAAMREVGAIVENPELYPYMTGMQNLKQYARMRGNISQQRINEVVAFVGLSNRIHEKVKKYSLGMRQRLGVAQALLHNPKVLILDEPTNGLDPAGIKQLRDLFKSLAHEHGICVIVSSHLMSEMELMCDRVGIIINGVIHTVKSVPELVEMVSGTLSEYTFHVNDANAAENHVRKVLEYHYPITDDAESVAYKIQVAANDCLSISIPKDGCSETIAACNTALIQGGVILYSVAQKESAHLEDAFIQITMNGGVQIV